MSDRAVDSHEGATVCPFVAFQDDRDRRATDPDHRHRCYAELQPAPRAIAHQRRYCLSPEFPSCPTFQDWAVRAAATGVSLPSARTVGLDAPPPAAAASVANGGSKRSFDWAAPPRWVAEASGTTGDRPAGSQMTAFDDGDEIDDAGAGDDEAGSMPPAAAAASRSSPSDGTNGEAGYPAPVSAAGTAERPHSGRGFAYDLIAQDAAFAPAPGPEPEPDDQDEDLEGAAPTGSTVPVPPTAAQAPVARLERHHDDLAPSRPQPAPPPPEAAPRASRVPPSTLPPPEYLPPGRQMATPIGAAGSPGPFDGGREWERPRRFEAYPTLRTRVGLPGLPRAGRLPPVVIGLIALALAAGFLFMLPGFFAGGPNTAEPSRTPRPAVSVKPTTPPPPTPQTYTVKRGDNLYDIAKRFGVSKAELLAANPQITNENVLRIGQVINIPDPFATSTPSDGTGPSAGAEPS